MEYFHISPIENRDKILNEGLKSSYNEIFISNNELQLILIASNQIFTNEYSVFKILPEGINGKILPDNVAEIGSGHQYIIKQGKISPKHIEFVRDEIWNIWDLEEASERIKLSIMGQDVESNLESCISYNNEWCEHYNKKYNKNLKCILPKKILYKN